MSAPERRGAVHIAPRPAKILAVLDVNVLVDALVGKPGSPAARTVEAWRQGKFQQVVSSHILDMLSLVLSRSQFDDTDPGIKAMFQAHVRWTNSRYTELSQRVYNVAPDAEDDKVLATALSGGAHYIVTSDRRFLDVGAYRGVRIVEPTSFLGLLEAEPTSDG